MCANERKRGGSGAGEELPDTHPELAFRLASLFSLKPDVPGVVFSDAKIEDIVQTDIVQTTIWNLRVTNESVLQRPVTGLNEALVYPQEVDRDEYSEQDQWSVFITTVMI